MSIWIVRIVSNFATVEGVFGERKEDVRFYRKTGVIDYRALQGILGISLHFSEYFPCLGLRLQINASPDPLTLFHHPWDKSVYFILQVQRTLFECSTACLFLLSRF